MADEVRVLLIADNKMSRELKAAASDMSAVGREGQRTGGILQGLAGTLRGALTSGLKVAALAATGLVTALALGFAGVATAGFELNSSVEDVRAQIMAFTKDATQTDAILASIKEEAATTPFAFQEMARAYASLLPAAKSSNAEMSELIELSEILAASNPAEGLEGAAFALKEALGGDFVSIVERFNLPRQRLAQLKDEGVPAMEAVRLAMLEMGLDADLVAGMAETWSGRWSTFLDTVDTLKTRLMTPVFDLLKTGLENLQPWLDANEEAFGLMAERVGVLMASGIQELAQWVMPKLEWGWRLLADSVTTAQEALAGNWVDSEMVRPLHRFVGIVFSAVHGAQELATAFADSGGWERMRQQLEDALPVLQAVAVGFGAFVIIGTVVGWIGSLILAWGGLTAAVSSAGGILAAVVAVLGGPVTITIGLISIAIGALAYAWTTNWGDIQGKTQAAWDYLAPIFESVRAWLEVNLPLAGQALADFWNNTLVPAFQNTWTFVNDSLIPLLAALANVIGAVLDLAVRSLMKLWTEQLQPGLQATWNLIAEYLIPIFDDVAKAIGATEKPIDDASKKLSDMRDWFKWLVDEIARAVSWLSQLADAIRGMPTLNLNQADMVPDKQTGGGGGGSGGGGGGGVVPKGNTDTRGITQQNRAAGGSVTTVSFGAGAIVVHGGTKETVEAGMVAAFRRAGLTVA